MTIQKTILNKTFSVFYSLCIMVFILSSLESCTELKIAYETNKKHPAIIKLKENKTLEGYAALPQKSKKVKLYKENTNGKLKLESILSPKEVDHIEFYYKNKKKNITSDKPNSLHAVSTKKNGGEYWMVEMCEGPHLRAFIQGDNYILDPDKIRLVNIGYNNSVNSFSIYLQKKGDYAHFIGLHQGIINEDTSLRRGMIKYLQDDEKLSQNILDSRLKFDDICDIVSDYKTGKLKYTKRVQNNTKPEDNYNSAVFTASLAYEMGLQKETPMSIYVDFNLPMFSSKYVFTGIHIGTGFVRTIDKDNLPLNFTSIDDYTKTKASLMLGGIVGFRFPIHLNKNRYFVPSLGYDLKTYAFSTMAHGPKLELAYRIPHKYGSSFVIYGGAKYNMPIFSDSENPIYQYTWKNYYTGEDYSIKFGEFISASLGFGYTF